MKVNEILSEVKREVWEIESLEDKQAFSKLVLSAWPKPLIPFLNRQHLRVGGNGVFDTGLSSGTKNALYDLRDDYDTPKKFLEAYKKDCIRFSATYEKEFAKFERLVIGPMEKLIAESKKKTTTIEKIKALLLKCNSIKLTAGFGNGGSTDFLEEYGEEVENSKKMIDLAVAEKIVKKPADIFAELVYLAIDDSGDGYCVPCDDKALNIEYIKPNVSPIEKYLSDDIEYIFTNLKQASKDEDDKDDKEDTPVHRGPMSAKWQAKSAARRAAYAAKKASK